MRVSLCELFFVDDRFSEALHLFQLRAALEQEEVYACLFKGADTVCQL
jgi:hypothetical protein